MPFSFAAPCHSLSAGMNRDSSNHLLKEQLERSTWKYQKKTALNNLASRHRQTWLPKRQKKKKSVQGVTLLLPCDSWWRLQQFPLTLSSGIIRYRKWMNGWISVVFFFIGFSFSITPFWTLEQISHSWSANLFKLCTGWKNNNLTRLFKRIICFVLLRNNTKASWAAEGWLAHSHISMQREEGSSKSLASLEWQRQQKRKKKAWPCSSPSRAQIKRASNASSQDFTHCGSFHPPRLPGRCCWIMMWSDTREVWSEGNLWLDFTIKGQWWVNVRYLCNWHEWRD